MLIALDYVVIQHRLLWFLIVVPFQIPVLLEGIFHQRAAIATAFWKSDEESIVVKQDRIEIDRGTYILEVPLEFCLLSPFVAREHIVHIPPNFVIRVSSHDYEMLRSLQSELDATEVNRQFERLEASISIGRALKSKLRNLQYIIRLLPYRLNNGRFIAKEAIYTALIVLTAITDIPGKWIVLAAWILLLTKTVATPPPEAQWWWYLVEVPYAMVDKGRLNLKTVGFTVSCNLNEVKKIPLLRKFHVLQVSELGVIPFSEQSFLEVEKLATSVRQIGIARRSFVLLVAVLLASVGLFYFITGRPSWETLVESDVSKNADVEVVRTIQIDSGGSSGNQLLYITIRARHLSSDIATIEKSLRGSLVHSNWRKVLPNIFVKDSVAVEYWNCRHLRTLIAGHNSFRHDFPQSVIRFCAVSDGLVAKAAEI
jgi:hypothetical protein